MSHVDIEVFPGEVIRIHEGERTQAGWTSLIQYSYKLGLERAAQFAEQTDMADCGRYCAEQIRSLKNE